MARPPFPLPLLRASTGIVIPNPLDRLPKGTPSYYPYSLLTDVASVHHGSVQVVELLAAAGAWYRRRAAIVILGSSSVHSGKGHQRRYIVTGLRRGVV